MIPSVHFIIHLLIGIAALAMLCYAFFQPLATVTIDFIGNIKVSNDIYITHSCLSSSPKNNYSENTCKDLSPVYKPTMQAIMGIVIALMVCIVLEIISMGFSKVACHIFGVLVLCLSIALIVLVAVLTGFSAENIFSKGQYKLTNTSIGVLVIASLLVLFELCCNKLVHRVVLSPYRLIAGKKA
jgi:hypothetical protein